NCGAQMRADQDWCLQCGAGAPGSLQAASRAWGPVAAVLAAVALLVAGAAAAGYAALSKSSAKPRTRAASVARSPALNLGAAAATPPPAATTPLPTVPKLGALG